MSKPTLSFYTNIPTPYQLDFFKELAKLFHLKVIYYSKTESNRSWHLPNPDDYEVIFLKDTAIARIIQKWIIDFHFSWQIIRIAFTDKSDFIIVGGAYWMPNASLALIAGKLKRKKVAYFSEPLYEVKNWLKYGMKWIVLRVVNTCCHSLFCVGKKAAKSFENYHVTVPKFIIPYNINSSIYKSLDKVKLEGYIKKYKSNNEVIILTSGALIERKGMDILVKAIKSIKNESLRLIIIGDGPMKKELKAMSASDNRVVLAGQQQPEETPYFFAIADMFALASRYDGWAVVVNEAIAANLPIVSSDKVGAAVDLIASQELGVLCESENVFQFAWEIGDLAKNTDRRNSIKKNAEKLIPIISSQYNAQLVFDIFTTKV